MNSWFAGNRRLTLDSDAPEWEPEPYPLPLQLPLAVPEPRTRAPGISGYDDDSESEPSHRVIVIDLA